MFKMLKKKLTEFLQEHGIYSEPSFSFIMPAYNRAFCIEKAINSLINQEYLSWELIIVDDGSSDGTEDLIREKYGELLKRNKIRYIRTEHSGVCAARNLGVSLAKNKWVGCLDTDNEMCKDYLTMFKRAILKNKRSKCFYAQIQTLSGAILGRPFVYEELLRANHIDIGVFIYHKSLVEKYGGYDVNLKRLEDWELIIRYTKENFPIFIEKPLLLYDDSNEHERITNKESFDEAHDYRLKKHNIKSES